MFNLIKPKPMCGITTKTKRHKAKACECHAHPYIPLFNAFIFVNRGAEVESLLGWILEQYP